jgi:hypothetical protein
MPVRPLAVPPTDDASAGHTAAVELFVERARSLRLDFALTDHNRSAVYELCRRLEGIPLAIELAAARVQLLTPQALLDRIDAHLDLLVAKAPDVPARQRTLTATIEWSHALLSEAERVLFARLAVFEGGFTLAAAEGVCDEGIDVLETLSGLVEHSLVTVSAAPGAAPRFRMFELIRAFALDRLEELGETAHLRDRHLSYFEGLAGEAEHALRGVDHLRWMAIMTPEWDNLRAAWWHAIALHQTQRASPLAGAGFLLLWKLGRLREMWPLIEATLDVTDELDANTKAGTYFAASVIRFGQGDYESSKRYIEQFDEIRADVDDTMLLGVSHLSRAFLAGVELDLAELDHRLHEAERVLRAGGEDWMLAVCLSARGALASLLGDEDRARSMQTEVFELADRTGNDAIALQSLVARAMSDLSTDDPEGARALLRQALPYFQDYPYFESVAFAYEAGAGLAIATGEPETAGHLLGAADMGRRTMAAALWPLQQPKRDAIASRIQERVGSDELERLRAEGAALDPLAAVELLGSLTGASDAAPGAKSG